MIDWSRHFDHIYCFHFVNSKERLDTIKEEFRRVGILDSGIFSFVYTSPDPWEKCIAEKCPRVVCEEESNRGFVNLGLASARTFREAIALGYRRVLFLENDIRFLKDLNLLSKIVEATPDRDIVQYDKFLQWEKTYEQYVSQTNDDSINEFFYDPKTEFLASGGCFSASARAMEAMARWIETNGPRPVDGLFHKVGVSRAVAKVNGAIQVVFGDALIWKYFRHNTHHKAYLPMKLDYSMYQVPDGYGYKALTTAV